MVWWLNSDISLDEGSKFAYKKSNQIPHMQMASAKFSYLTIKSLYIIINCWDELCLIKCICLKSTVL